MFVVQRSVFRVPCFVFAISPNTEHRVPNHEPRTTNIEPRTSNRERRTQHRTWTRTGKREHRSL